MADNTPIDQAKPIQLKYYGLGIALVWTLFIVIALVW